MSGRRKLAEIRVEGLSKVYANGVVAVRDVWLDVADGKFLVLVGPSGCGKSTLLRMIAGLEEVTAGELMVDGREVTDAQPRERDIAMVFQSYALYPHMTVRKNIGYPLRLAGLPSEEIAARVNEAARLLQLEAVLDRKPGQLSGGQRPRGRGGPAWGGRGGPALRPQAVSLPHGRAALEPRREVASADARRDMPAATRVPHHHDLRHSRPGRSDDHGRPGSSAQRWADRAMRQAARSVRPTDQPVRRRVHRLADNELLLRDGRTPRWRPGRCHRQRGPAPRRVGVGRR